METKVALTKDEEAVDVDVTPKTLHLIVVKRIFKYLKGKSHLGLWYPKESPFDLEAFSDSDYGGSNLDRKSTIGGCQFLGQRLILWQCKKHTIDYGFNFMNTKIHIDNESTICIVKNPVYHSKTKHIEIRHHFIRDCYEKKLISVEKIHTDLNVADLLTKPFDGPQFNYLVVSIGIAWIYRCKAGVISEKDLQTLLPKLCAENKETLELQATLDTIEYTSTEATRSSICHSPQHSSSVVPPTPPITQPIPSEATTIPPLSQPTPPTPITATTTVSPSHSPSPTHKPMEHTFEQPSSDQQPPTPRQEATTSQLMTRIDDLEKQLKETKQTFGNLSTLVERSINAGRLDALEKALEKEEVAKQVHLDSLIAQRMAEEQELTEEQKKRKAQVQFEAQSYTEEDWDTIRAKLEANAELKESVLGKDLTVEDYAKRMVELDSIPSMNKDNMKISDEANEKDDTTSGIYQIVRENGTDMVYISFGAMLTDISRDDLTELYRIVMKKHGMNEPEDEFEKEYIVAHKEKNSDNSYLRDILGKDMHYPFTLFFVEALGFPE
ncbi:hypothetical protein Tco_0295298 [Tanacetum coccineum]